LVAWAKASSAPELSRQSRDWVNDVFKTGRRSISSIRKTPSGIQYVVVGYPVHDQSEHLVATVGFFVQLKAIQDSLAALPLPNGSVVTVVQPDGRIVARSQEPGRYVGQMLPEAMRPSAEIRDPVERTSVDGVRRMYGEARVDNAPWLVSVGLP